MFSIIYKDGHARLRDQREKRESIMVIFNEERRTRDESNRKITVRGGRKVHRKKEYERDI